MKNSFLNGLNDLWGGGYIIMPFYNHVRPATKTIHTPPRWGFLNVGKAKDRR